MAVRVRARISGFVEVSSNQGIALAASRRVLTFEIGFSDRCLGLQDAEKQIGFSNCF